MRLFKGMHNPQQFYNKSYAKLVLSGVIREKASDDLFAIDVKGDSNISKKYPKHAKKTLKADEVLAERSAIPALEGRKRSGDKTTNGLMPVKRQKNDWVSGKDLARLRRIADGQHENTIQITDATFDLWDAPVEVAPKNGKPAKRQVKQPRTMKEAPISLIEGGKQAAAVTKPAGGFSYNPVFADYEERLAEESEKALATEKKRLDDEEKERLRQEASAKSAAEADAAEERANLSEWEEDSEWEGVQSGVEDEKASTKRPKRKTPAQRNRMKRRKEEEQLAKHKAALKKQRTQVQHLNELTEEIDANDKNKQLVLAEGEEADYSDADEIVDDNKLRRRQLGKYKLPERDLELVLPDELQESLRLLKPEGNLLKDRYRSMLVRGKVESRRHIPFHKQARKKVTEKWTHKDFVL